MDNIFLFIDFSDFFHTNFPHFHIIHNIMNNENHLYLGSSSVTNTTNIMVALSNLKNNKIEIDWYQLTLLVLLMTVYQVAYRQTRAFPNLELMS